MGWRPPIRGGNGKPPPVPQTLLACALGWEMEIIVRTHKKKDSGWPNHYKIDVGNTKLKVAIEVDGQSHYSRKDQDRRKGSFLKREGWKVLRFSNKQVTERLGECVQTVLSTISK